jgi:hypothetical protein
MSNTIEHKAQFEARLAALEIGTTIQLKLGEQVIVGEVCKINKASFQIRTTEGDVHKLDIKSEWVQLAKRDMSATLAKYREQYVLSIASAGRKSLSKGDDLAELLQMLTGKQVCQIAELALGIEGLWAKYERLNNGQQRMNAGNRIRAAIKRGDLTIEEVQAAKSKVAA